MEIRKPDEIGEVGQEAIGPLSLPRPEGKWSWLPKSIIALPAFYVVWVLFSVEELSINKLRWSQKDAAEFTLFLGVSCVLGVFFVEHIIRRYSPTIKLHIEKGEQIYASEKKHFEIWNGINVFTRSISPLFLMFLGVWLIKVGVLGNFWSERLNGLLGLGLCVFVALNKIRPIFHPLLMANRKGIDLLGHFNAWDQIQRVEVEHVTDLDGSFSAVIISVVSADGRKMGRTRLAKEKLSAVEEKELLEFFARRLGSNIASVAPTPSQ